MASAHFRAIAEAHLISTAPNCSFACSSFLAYLDTRAFRNDTLRVKILLMTVMTFLTLQSAISMFSVWHYSTNQHRDEDTFYSQTVADCFATGPVAVVGGLIQGFLAYRASSVSLFLLARR